ncbi:ATP-binding protein [Butyrivibrio sp. AE2032]|uniref:ATP-binding protein n=1 Tax=Butyrivibrio sp. AE2032 TaxID=1458463 RepID=UPI00055896F3|nr:ATP-binding protein [Butyrivibrio sp. AE2032]
MKELKIDALVENLDQVLAFVDAELEAMECSMKTQMQIDVAVEELFVNIASYAYAPETGDAIIGVESFQDPQRVEITFIDEGIEYDPLKKEDPDVTLAAEERQIGGLGIYMVKKSMDNMEYKRQDGKNILKITKNL